MGAVFQKLTLEGENLGLQLSPHSHAFVIQAKDFLSMQTVYRFYIFALAAEIHLVTLFLDGLLNYLLWMAKWTGYRLIIDIPESPIASPTFALDGFALHVA